MEIEDDTFILIVGDEIGNSTLPAPFQIKKEDEETLHDNINVLVENLPNEAEKQEKIKLNVPHFKKTDNVNEVDNVKELEYLNCKDEPIEEFALEYIDDDLLDGNEGVENKPEYRIHFVDAKKKNKKRSKMTRQSYVKIIMDNYPELKDDKELLINCLVGIMKNTKPPPPPRDYYIMNGIMLECIQCGYKSESIPAAGRHYQKSHGVRYLFCFACGVNFRSTTNLYKHEKHCRAPDAVTVLKARAIFLGRKGRSRPFIPVLPDREPMKYECEECSASFCTKSSLVAHQYTHRGLRPFRCRLCARAYTSCSALARHARSHDDRRFTCEHCRRSFNGKPALAAHMDTHRPLKRYACGECDKRYAQRAALRLHVDREHRGLPPPCACKLCPRRYPRMSLLKIHMKKMHGMVIMTRKIYCESLFLSSRGQVLEFSSKEPGYVELFHITHGPEPFSICFVPEPTTGDRESTLVTTMFFKMLPTLSESQLQRATLVMKTEVENPNYYSFPRPDAQPDRFR